jgi:hypothetical protein
MYKNIILAVAFYGCEMWSLTLKEEHILRVFEKRVLRRIFGPKRNEVIGGRRKLRIEELHNLYSSSRIIRMIRSKRMTLTEHVARMGRIGMHIGFCWESQKVRPLEIHSCRWEGNIKMDIKETGYGGVDWIDLNQARGQWKAPVNTVMNLRVP